MKKRPSEKKMLWEFMPKGLSEIFEIVDARRTEKSMDIWLDEKREQTFEDKYNKDIVGDGYTEYHTVQDHMVQGVPTFLHLRKCRWLDKKTGQTFTYEIDYGNEDGTQLSKDLAAFLK